ncbi:MAG: sigma-70 family RNA polymerase sigma factor [Arenimonas sp.]|uniref:sigma-70 family RNA polymerase sigma factor n=1 Tax=Arenimonas sp. TaxID=1872635 RepID=UPI0025C147A0|nr:sigma-70 family RNA polymerase sigma factor [Arenimonas sp.]MBW8368755.1 sigma-70 family RNA polymerase sigma factor [Arenimonas sp.]
MDAPEPDELENLADPDLVKRLRCVDWNDPLFVSEERLVQLFVAARTAGHTARVGLCSSELSRRLLRRAQAFARKNTLVPQHFSDYEEAAQDLAGYVWERLLSGTNIAFAARRFGVFFENKSISYLRALLAECRQRMDSLEEWHQAGHDDGDEGDDEMAQQREDDHDGDDADATLQDDATPDRVLSHSLQFRHVHARLRVLLTRNEYSVFVMLWRQEMKIKDIAAALGVTPRMVNNYKRSIEAKMKKEFNV